MMDAPRWQQVRALFEELVDADPVVVAQRLAALRDHDRALAAEISSLLDHHSRAGEFLSTPAALLPDEDDALAPGTHFGTYVIDREVGRGGMGRVYAATDTRLLRRVCLKIVRPELVQSPAAQERLRREARVAASIEHPAICAVHALEEIDGAFAIVTEYVDGSTLRSEIERRRLSAAAVSATFAELASALAFVHTRGITHSDLKPENIMRTRDGRLKIVDFGVARVEQESAGERLYEAFAGTLTYMAPEQINGAPADARSDVFALGIVAYECAAGVHPFAAATSLATTGRILEGEPPPIETIRPDLPQVVSEAIGRCLQKAPASRFASAAALADFLASGSAGVVPRRSDRWWRVHQIVVAMLYATTTVVAWIIKEWDLSRPTRLTFAAIGVLAAGGAIIRGHLLFTSQTHPHRLDAERHRTAKGLVLCDLLLAAVLFVDAAMVVDSHPVFAVVAMGLAVGIAAAVLIIEPATTASAFGDGPPASR
jgi:hypothetical protein